MNASKINSGHLASLKKRRKLWLKVHLYLGLFAGAILLVIGLTGSILSFWLDI
ncbi:MAG: PepSY domain-containing protein, partial [Gammaproteobacteria bacterium]|nr:PepSY domain-containing protein [Gammaproteobacteria bacterium]